MALLNTCKSVEFTTFCLARQNPYLQNSVTLKALTFVWILCEAKHIRPAPMCANEPKDAESQPF